MSKRKDKIKEYLRAIIMLIIFVFLIFIFDLPKTNFIAIGVIAIFSIFLYEVFGSKDNGEKMSKRKKEYMGSIILLIVFTLIIFIFDAPKKAYAIIGIIAVSNILLYEVFNLKS